MDTTDANEITEIFIPLMIITTNLQNSCFVLLVLLMFLRIYFLQINIESTVLALHSVFTKIEGAFENKKNMHQHFRRY